MDTPLCNAHTATVVIWRTVSWWEPLSCSGPGPQAEAHSLHTPLVPQLSVTQAYCTLRERKCTLPHISLLNSWNETEKSLYHSGQSDPQLIKGTKKAERELLTAHGAKNSILGRCSPAYRGFAKQPGKKKFPLVSRCREQRKSSQTVIYSSATDVCQLVSDNAAKLSK